MDKPTKQRSLEQNAYLWGVAYKTVIDCLPASSVNAVTINPEYWHEFFCELYFGTVEIGFPGSGKTRAKRTTTTDERGKRNVISTTEFMDFVTCMQAKCAEHGITVLSPNEPPMVDAA